MRGLFSYLSAMSGGYQIFELFPALNDLLTQLFRINRDTAAIGNVEVLELLDRFDELALLPLVPRFHWLVR